MPVVHSQYREAGKVSIERELCDQCLACAHVCPTEVLVVQNQTVQIRPESSFGCIGCGHCMMVCRSGAVRVTGRGISPADLRPQPQPQEKASPAALAALMQSRRSIRRFSGREVDDALLERIVTMATMAPMGIPPWDVGCITVHSRTEVQALAREVMQGYKGFLKIFQPWMLTIMRPLLPKVKRDWFAHFLLPLAESYVQGVRENRDLLFYDAPALLLFHHSPYADAADAFIACTYAMLAAESLGLGSTMIGAAAPIIQRNHHLRRSLGLPDGNKPAIVLILGYPATRFHHSVQRHFIGQATNP